LYLEGAAWASLVAQAVMAVMSLYLLKRKTNISLIPRLPLHPELGRLVLMSLNLFVRAVALNIALILAVREAAALGDVYIGAHTIAINLWLFAAFIIDGYAAAGNIMGGRLLGSADYNGLWVLAKKIVYYGTFISMVLIAGAFLFYEPLGRLFSNEPVVLQAFYAVFFIVILGLSVNSIAFVFDGLFKGLGEMKYLRNVLLSATFLGFIPALYLGRYLGWGLSGIWIAFTVWMVIRGGALVWKFRDKFYPLLQKA
jgi:Na+-driven multidrug efflux pump